MPCRNGLSGDKGPGGKGGTEREGKMWRGEEERVRGDGRNSSFGSEGLGESMRVWEEVLGLMRLLGLDTPRFTGLRALSKVV